MTLQWQNIHLPLAQGIDTKVDERALPPPKLIALENARFVAPGGLRKRFGNTLLGANTDQGGVITAPRKIAAYKNGLALFTQHDFYSYDSDDDTWILRGKHDAVAVTETPIAGKQHNQYTADRAELSGKVFYVWQSLDGGVANSWVRVHDASTGAVVVADYYLGASISLPRVIALDTRVLLVAYAGSNTLKCKALDPADPMAGITGAWTTIGTNAAGKYDLITKSASAAVIMYTGNTLADYSVGTITSGLVVSMNVKARASADIVAVAYASASNLVYTFRRSGTTILADILNGTTFADVTTGTTVATLTGGTWYALQITAAFRTVTEGGYYRCYLWVSEYDNGASFETLKLWHNWIDTNGAYGSAQVTGRQVGLASRAWVYDSEVYVCQSTASAMQSSLFVCARPTSTATPPTPVCGVVHAKALANVAVSPKVSGAPLPTVANIGGSTFALCSIARTRIDVPGSYTYANTNPVDILLEFDAASARECHEVGDSLYIGGGVVKLFDGLTLVESGFHTWPEFVTAAVAAGGSMTASSTYYYRVYWEWVNDRGERELSTYASTTTVTTDATNKKATLTIPTITITEKQRRSYATANIGIAVYRTEANSAGPYHRVTSLNPDATGDNGAAFNDPTAATVTFTDAMSDATLITKDIDYRSQSELDNTSPPASTVIARGQDRLFVGSGSTVYFSKLRYPGDMVAFNDALMILLPRDGGHVTGVAVLDTMIVIFTQRRIYACTGVGPNNVGVGEYGTPQIVAVDVGCKDQRTIVPTPQGVMFLSDRGFYILTRSLDVQYIGAPVEAYNGNAFTSGVLVNAEHQVRFTASGDDMLVYDYLVDQWSTYTIQGNTACTFDGVYYFATGLQVRKESAGAWLDDGAADFGLVAETAWIKVSQLQGYGKVRWLSILGEWRSTHRLRVRVAYDYKNTWIDDVYWTPPTSSAGDPEQLRMRVSRQKIEALRVRIEDVQNDATARNEAIELSGISLEIGFKPGLMRLPAANTG